MASNPPIRLPLVTSLQPGTFSSKQDAKMVNCFADQVTQDAYAVAKRSGLSSFFQGAVGCGQGMYNFLEILYSISGDMLNINATSTSTFIQTTPSTGWSARKGMFGAGFNGFLYALGGLNQDGVTYKNDVWRSPDGINWTQLPTASWSPRAYAQSIVFNGALYVMGGMDATTFNADVWSTTDGITWTLMAASAWPGRANFGVTLFNGNLWIAGGQASGTLDNGNTLNDVWTTANGVSWTNTVRNAPWAGRSRLGFAGFNNKLRVLGGYMGAFVGAGSDQWSSTDGVTWARDSSNPFGQAATGVFPLVAMTSLGFNFGIAPNVTLTGGGGTGATGFSFVVGMEEDGADDYDGPMNVTINAAGTGYTSAPALGFTLGGGIPPSGYTFLNANGVAGDKRGMFVVANGALYFFTFMNNGSPSDEIWVSTDGTTWAIYQSNPTYAARDSYAYYFGSFWVLSGMNSSNVDLTDVWRGSFAAGSQLALSPTVTCLPFSFSQTSASLTHSLLFFKTNKDAYTYNADLTTLTKVSNVNYPATTVPGIVYLDTFFFVMDPQGKIWNSAINDPTTWTALGVIPLQGEPNGGVAIGKVGQYLVALGVWSTQFFYDNAVAAPASPLAVNSTLDSLVGCASGDSLVSMQSTMIWVGQNRSEGRGVFMIQNLVPTRISTPYIDRLLAADNLSSVRSFATGDSGHSFYVLTLVNTNVTLVYDFMTASWYEFTSTIPSTSTVITSLTSNVYGVTTAISANHNLSDGDPTSISGASVLGYNGSFNISYVDTNTFTYNVGSQLAPATGASSKGYTDKYFIGRGSASLGGSYFIQHETNGLVYLSSQLNTTDNGSPIDVLIGTPVWDGGTTNYKTFPDTGVVADNNSSSCLLRYTNDDYVTFSLFRAIDMSIMRKHLSRSGRARRRAWQIRHTANTPFRAFGIEITPEAGDF